MRMVNAEQVHALLDFPHLIEALCEGYRQQPAVTQSVLLQDQTGGTAFLALPAWEHGRAMGINVVTVFRITQPRPRPCQRCRRCSCCLMRRIIPPNTRHWHGAAPDRLFTHLAMSETGEDGSGTAWFEHVSDSDYGKKPA